jgi:hypothetical protein
VHVKLNGTASKAGGVAESLPIFVDQYDRTWRHGETDPAHDRAVLLILLLRGSVEDASRIQEHLLALLSGGARVAGTRTESAGADWVRLRIVLTGVIFPDRVELLEDFLNQCRRQDLIVNRNDMDGL